MKKKKKSKIPSETNTANLSSEYREIAEWLKKVSFKRRFFGGVDEADVWRKMEEMNSLYEKALIMERTRAGAEPGSASSAEDVMNEHE